MKQLLRKISSLLLMLSLLAVPAHAAESTVTYTGRDDLFAFAPGSVYTETDLFEDFKQVMPGDVRTETVTVSNQYRGCDYVKIWMGALLHDEEENPISPNVLEELEADERRETLSELEYMHDFLEQLTLTVWLGEKTNENIIYQGAPNSLEDGFEGENVYLGRFDYGDSVTLNVELAVDIEIGNEYADRIGEVDWVFVVEEHDSPSHPDDPDDPDDPDTPDEPDVPVPPPDDPDIPLNPPDEPGNPPSTPDTPKTGDDTIIWPYILLFGAGLVGMIVTTVGKKKEKEES